MLQVNGYAIRDAQPADAGAVLSLNAAWVRHLSPMDSVRLANLAAASSCYRVVEVDGQVEAFILAFRKGADYDGAIFQLLSSRAEDFLYIDRIVVSENLRRKGIAARLYDEVVDSARRVEVDSVLCEVNVAPPNPESAHFHEHYGFREIGRHTTGEGKTVALLAYDV